ncbi:MAG TPA: hypothetical protein PLQ67_07200, partial [Burkholderiaceae bacterium]|nr:hypothetical protein [Burkholderiaceae bacterium]
NKIVNLDTARSAAEPVRMPYNTDKLAQLTAKHGKGVVTTDPFPKPSPQRIPAAPPTHTALNYGVARLNELKEQFGSGNDVRYRQRNHVPNPNDPLPQMLSGSARKENTLWLAGTALDLSDALTLGGKTAVKEGALGAGAYYLSTRHTPPLGLVVRKAVDPNSKTAQQALRQWLPTPNGQQFMRAVEALPTQARVLTQTFEQTLNAARQQRASGQEGAYRTSVQNAYEQLWRGIDKLYTQALQRSPEASNNLGRHSQATDAAAKQLLNKTHTQVWEQLSAQLAQRGVLPRYTERPMPHPIVILSPASEADHAAKLRFKAEGGDIRLLPPEQQKAFKLHAMNPGMYYAAQQGDKLAAIHMQYRYGLVLDVTDANRAERLHEALTLRNQTRTQLTEVRGQLTDERNKIRTWEQQLASKKNDSAFMARLDAAREKEAALNAQANQFEHILHSIAHARKSLGQASIQP